MLFLIIRVKGLRVKGLRVKGLRIKRPAILSWYLSDGSTKADEMGIITLFVFHHGGYHFPQMAQRAMPAP